jgi:hypothetical protein
MSEVSPEPIHPETDTFVTDIDPAFVEKVLDVAQRQRESDIHHHAKLDDLRRGFKVAKRVRGHFPRLNAKTARLKPGSADNTSRLNQAVKPDRKFLLRMLKNVLYCTNSMILAPEGAQP